jgi:hypothetical protein
MDMFDCDVHEWLCHIDTFISVDLCLFPSFMNGYAALWCRSNLMSHCDIHRRFFHIAAFIEGYVGLWHSFMVISDCNIRLSTLMAMSYCNFHKIPSHISMFINGCVAL